MNKKLIMILKLEKENRKMLVLVKNILEIVLAVLLMICAVMHIRREKKVSSVFKNTNIKSDEEGMKLSELIGMPVRRICPDSASGDRSYTILYDYLIIPVKKTSYGVYCITSYLDFTCDNELEFEILENDTGWEEITDIMEECEIMQGDLGISYKFDKYNKFKEAYQKAIKIIENSAYLDCITKEKTSPSEEQ